MGKTKRRKSFEGSDDVPDDIIMPQTKKIKVLQGEFSHHPFFILNMLINTLEYSQGLSTILANTM